MSDRWAVAVAVAVWCGAALRLGAPWPVCLVLVVAGLAMADPRLLLIGALLLSGLLAQRSWSGLTPPPLGPVASTATLVSDPVPRRFGTEAEVRLHDRRVLAIASGGPAGALAASSAGERVRLEGSLRRPPRRSDWMVARHLVAVLSVRSAERVDAGAAPWRAANRLRRLVARGAGAMAESDRSLYLGFVYGDDRGQSPEVVDDFRGSGLSHVLVVSGENLAFLLALLRPVRERLAWRGRWALTMVAIGAFGLVVRFEPSVLRACAMAAVAVSAGAAGRPASGLRVLALAVSALVLVDPLLVRSLGFQLSVGASLAIALLASSLAERIPGPRTLAEVVAVTIAAQLGVAPVLLPRFGGLPVVALVANPLAVPVAALVTTYGLPAGLLAGAAGGSVGRALHLPTTAFVRWVALVARVGASLPLGQLDARHVVVLLLLGACWWWARGALRGVALVAALLVLALPALALRAPAASVVLPSGALLVRSAGATCLEVGPAGDPGRLLAELREAGVTRIETLVAPERSLPALERTLGHRWPIDRAVGSDRDRPTARGQPPGGARCAGSG